MKRAVTKHDASSGSELLSGMHEGMPGFFRPAGHYRRYEQTLDRAAGRDPVSQQSRRKHARVVDDDDIAGVEKAGDAIDRRVRAGSGARN